MSLRGSTIDHVNYSKGSLQKLYSKEEFSKWLECNPLLTLSSMTPMSYKTLITIATFNFLIEFNEIVVTYKIARYLLVSILSNCQACLLCISKTFFLFQERWLSLWDFKMKCNRSAQTIFPLEKMHKINLELRIFQFPVEKPLFSAIWCIMNFPIRIGSESHKVLFSIN